MTPDQEALLALFKTDFTPENQGIKLLEKLEKWKQNHWNGTETERIEERVSVEKTRLKIDLFVAWFKDQVARCDKETSGGSDSTHPGGHHDSRHDSGHNNSSGSHASGIHGGDSDTTSATSLIHDDLYLKVVRSRDGGEPLNLKDEGTMVGVFSKRPLKKGDPILKIPSKAMLIASDTLSLIMKVMNHDCVAGSSWKPYFDVLPRHFPTLPMYWNLEQISKIKTTSVFEEALQDMIMSYKQYLLISQVVSQRKMDLTSDLCTWPLFKWARGVVLTRQNPIKQVGLDQETVKTMYGLVPLYDFFNHQSGEISAFFDPALNILEMNAGFDSDADEQVFMSYGNRSNRQLFIYSGFIDKYSTQNDSISIPFSLSKNDPLFKKRSKLMDLMMLPKQGPLSLFNLYHPESEKCIQSLIIMFFEESDLLSCLSQIEKDLSVELNLAGIASKACMKKVWQWLDVRLQVSIKTNQKKLDAIQKPNEEIVKPKRDFNSIQVDELIEELYELELEVLQAILEQVKINLE